MRDMRDIDKSRFDAVYELIEDIEYLGFLVFKLYRKLTRRSIKSIDYGWID